MRLLFILAMVFMNTSVWAFECNENFHCQGSGVSKNDIKEISERLRTHSFNGRPFDLKAVQAYFRRSAKLEKPETKHYGPYWDKRRQFEKDYGNSREAEALFEIAKADYYIKKYENEHGMTFGDADRLVTDYRFIGNGRRQIYGKPHDSTCILDAKVGKADTSCEHNKGKSGIGGALLYLATAGNIGDPNGYRRENTTCTTEKPVRALVRSKEYGEEVVYAADFVAQGRAIEFDKNVWFRRGLKLNSKKECEEKLLGLEEDVRLHSCDRHNPFIEDQKDIPENFNRSPAVIEQFGKKIGKK